MDLDEQDKKKEEEEQQQELEEEQEDDEEELVVIAVIPRGALTLGVYVCVSLLCCAVLIYQHFTPGVPSGIPFRIRAWWDYLPRPPPPFPPPNTVVVEPNVLAPPDVGCRTQKWVFPPSVAQAARAHWP